MPGGELDIEFRSGARTRCVFQRGALDRLEELCAAAGLGGTGALLCDARLLATAWREPLLAYESTRLGAPIPRPISESRKVVAEAEEMCEALSSRGVQRDGFVIAVGGGVLTDLAGFAAAIYLRGIPWVSVPSTLLAQVDAGLGGKTGANLRSGKNLVGAFHQPRLVVCDAALLATLPGRERWSGLAEVVKCALLDPARDSGGIPLLDRCERDLERAADGDPDALAPLVEACVRYKADIVAQDEREGGMRAFLNLGHTVGHALEAATSYERFTHGEAVALGLRATLSLSRARGLLDEAGFQRAAKLVGRLRIAADRRLDEGERNAALEAVGRDKKARAGRVRFVLLAGLGAPRVMEVEPRECVRALEASLA
ncbi:MAG TPA: 3-dehydroquinate synthase family protein [Myxococcales bacterium]|nr:3-dehydroquinate synthase family protein [Myxococcales bacterium]